MESPPTPEGRLSPSGASLQGHVSVLERRLEELKQAIIRREWDEAETEYDRALRGFLKLKRASLAAEAADQRPALVGLVSSLYLYLSRHAETQLTTEEKELYYDCIDAGYPDTPPRDRWWR